jgi:hypothetical protein
LVLGADARLGYDPEAPIAAPLCEGGLPKATAVRVASFPAYYEETVALSDGTALPLVSYADAGKTWDENSKMAAWLKVK